MLRRPYRTPIARRRVVAAPGLVVAILALVVFPVVARAADPTEIEDLIRQGNDLRRAGKDERALPLLRKAYDLAGTPRTAAQLGLVEVALGYRLEAERHLSESLASPRDVWVRKNR